MVTGPPAEAGPGCSGCHLPPSRGNPASWCALWDAWLCANCRWARTERELDGDREARLLDHNPAWAARPDLPAEEMITL